MKSLAVLVRCLLIAVLCTGGAMQAGAAPPRSVLDRRTGATIRFSAKPWVLALEQPQLASHARDYIALYAVETNIGGTRRYQLAAFFWSTVPGRQQFAGASPTLRLQVQDRDLRLDSQGLTAREAGISQWPLQPPGRGALLVVYGVDQALLRQLATAAQFRLRPLTDATLPEDVWFTEWRSARRDFQSFAEQIMGP
jgi:hypothetical protein